jgi:hypothetical protein
VDKLEAAVEASVLCVGTRLKPDVHDAAPAAVIGSGGTISAVIVGGGTAIPAHGITNEASLT